MRISDWSSDVCSSDLSRSHRLHQQRSRCRPHLRSPPEQSSASCRPGACPECCRAAMRRAAAAAIHVRSEEHTSELQSLMRISYAVFCLKKKTNITHKDIQTTKKKKHNTTLDS